MMAKASGLKTSKKSKAKKSTAKKSTAKKSTAKKSAAKKPAPRNLTIASIAAGQSAAPLFASPVGSSQPFSTKPSASGNNRGSSTTTGLTGTTQKLDDGSVVTEATEALTAKRTDGLNASLAASCRRVTQDNTTLVHQLNYSYKQRTLSDSTLVTNVNSLSLAIPPGFQPTPVRGVKATQFGKNDRQDEGTGSPDMGLIQTNSEVFGGSVKVSVMVQIFGASWRSNSKRLGAMIDVFFPARKCMIRVPLVDVGPGELAPSHAEVDLTWASDQFLGTRGGATVSYRILVPS
jgi:hypothetical protein